MGSDVSHLNVSLIVLSKGTETSVRKSQFFVKRKVRKVNLRPSRLPAERLTTRLESNLCPPRLAAERLTTRPSRLTVGKKKKTRRSCRVSKARKGSYRAAGVRLYPTQSLKTLSVFLFFLRSSI